MSNLIFAGQTIHAANPFQPDDALALCGRHGSKGYVQTVESATCGNCLRSIAAAEREGHQFNDAAAPSDSGRHGQR